MKAVATKATDNPTANAKKIAMGKYSDRNSGTWHSCATSNNLGLINPAPV
jgi:hypothetical protein